MKVLGLVALGCATGVLGKPLAQRGDNVVDLAQGTVRGFNDDSGNAVFLGVPFADTTGGKNRYVGNIRLRAATLTNGALDGEHHNLFLKRRRAPFSMPRHTVQHVLKRYPERPTHSRARTVLKLISGYLLRIH